VAVLVLAADVISKVMVVARIPEQTYVHVIGSVFMLTQVRNGGAAFNLGGTSNTIVFTAIAVGVVTYILRAASRLRSIAWAITLGLLLGGATGNLIDRIFRAPGPFRGDVVDWIEVTRYWPVFNIADSCIVCAGVLVVLLALRGIRPDGPRPVPEASSSQPAISDEAPSASSSSSSSSPSPSGPAPVAAPSAPGAPPDRDIPKSEYRVADEGR
jgi:signal peptidase II